MRTGYLLLHGLTNRRAPGHWLRELAGALRREGELVAYPQLPDPDDPLPEVWREVVGTELALLREGGATEVVVAAHSLGALTWWHACARGLVQPAAARVLLVAPPGRAETAARLPRFVLPELTRELVRRGGPARLVASDADDWCAAGAAAEYAGPLGLDLDVVPGGGHLSGEEGYGSWPAVLAWAHDPTVRITSNRGQ